MTSHPVAAYRLTWALATLAIAMPGLTRADDALNYQIHGFASQAYATSWGNNYVGDSLDGTFDYYELGLNASSAYGPLTVSAQGLYRRFGELDKGGARLDYAFADYRFYSGMESNAGVRVGRVKNPYGLYNDSRDVIFTRPSILLPGSVYFEGAGVRSILFSSDGGQVYGGWGFDDHYLSLVASRALDYEADEDQERSLFGARFPGELEINGFTLVRLMDDWASGTWRAAFSYATAELAVKPSAGAPFPAGSLDADLYVLSLAHNGERYRITGEYQITRSRTSQSLGGTKVSGDGLYVQTDYLFMPHFTGYLRYDLAFSDRNDRDGKAYARETGGDRHTRYSRDLTFGLKWLPDTNWGVWAEQHLIQGSSTTPRLENQDRTIEADGGLFLLMVGYHF